MFVPFYILETIILHTKTLHAIPNPMSQLILVQWFGQSMPKYFILTMALLKILPMNVILSLKFADNEYVVPWPSRFCVAEFREINNVWAQGFTACKAVAFITTGFSIYFPIMQTQQFCPPTHPLNQALLLSVLHFND